MSKTKKEKNSPENIEVDANIQSLAEEAANETAEETAESMELTEESESIELSDDSEETELADIELSELELGDLESSPLEAAQLEDTELSQFESAPIEEIEFVEDERLESIIESILFATDKDVSLNSLKLDFKGNQVTTDKIKKFLDRLSVEYAGARRGVTLEEVTGGFQLKTKIDNLEFLRRTVKPRSFRLSGPALEVLAIVAYKQPIVKNEIDQIRGVESGHLLRALMERSLVHFEGKSDLPGRPMQYGTTKKFLEIFALRNLRELPTLSQIDELLPEGITEEESNDKPVLSGITETLAHAVTNSYSEGEEELEKIQAQLSDIETTSQFFEEEKLRQKNKREEERAQSIREALDLASVTGEVVTERDIQWLRRYDESKLQTL
ncbi:MAG: SMC-Scp complex subunit ScpB [Pseudobdellovibrionaceae bacterium]